MELAQWEITAIRLLPDAPEAAAWAREARELLERVGAVSLLHVLDESEAAGRGARTGSACEPRVAPTAGSEPAERV